MEVEDSTLNLKRRDTLNIVNYLIGNYTINNYKL